MNLSQSSRAYLAMSQSIQAYLDLSQSIQAHLDISKSSQARLDNINATYFIPQEENIADNVGIKVAYRAYSRLKCLI